MEAEKRLETIQEEIKLLKGELKNTLASVRDYLLNMELPSSEFSTILAALGSDSSGTQKITIDGSLASPKREEPKESPSGEMADQVEDITEETIEEDSELPSDDEDLLDMDEPVGDQHEKLSEDSLINEEDENTVPEDDIFSQEETGEDDEAGVFDEADEAGIYDEADEPEETQKPLSELSLEEEQPMDYDEKTITEASPGTPKVNMLANLISWIAQARKEIGYDQLTTLLEVYGISGHLSPELKEVILHLSEIASEQLETANYAQVWSQSMLSLHGILTGGDAPRYPLIPTWSEVSDEMEPVEEEIIEVDKKKEMPVKLKLVFPNGDGNSKEYCIDLTPDMDKTALPENPANETPKTREERGDSSWQRPKKRKSS